METETPSQKIECYLVALEARTEELLLLCERLRKENQMLQARHANLQVERDQLAAQNEQLHARIAAMVARLKGLEPSAS
ncbi:MAG TPA: TIGR02449 family protein [Candidatus Competibacteraceae bacterium]|nr:TIGR02449 family protein [Candidatus Competibacteraceae bacterium]